MLQLSGLGCTDACHTGSAGAVSPWGEGGFLCCYHFSANACLAPICSLHHVAVTTVEGIGSTKSRLHPVQERIAKSHGSQCGFCTPGIVMSMYTLLRNQPEPTMEEIEDAFQGNLCRCTGYRPILQGFRTFARDGGCCGGSGENLNCCLNQKEDHTVTLSPSLFNPEEFMPLDPTQEPIFPPELLVGDADALGRGPATSGCHEARETLVKHTSGDLCALALWVFLSSSDTGGQAPVSHTPKGTHTSRIHMSVGGNIITASPISDLNPVFMASGAKLTIVSTGTRRTVRMDHTFFPAYRKTLLAPEEILLSIEIPYSREGEYFSAFKQTSRRDDIAKVTSGMRVLFNPGTVQVKELALCYGGMADRTISALKTTQRQISHFWNEGLLQDVCAGLAEELSLAPDAPGGMVEFRRTLTLSFFFKFYLTVLQKLGKENSEDQCGKLDPTHASATLLFQKDPPANVQLFQEVPKGQSEEDMVGRSLPHLAAAMQASGEAVYCDDIPRYENELSLRLVTSTQAHAKIKSIDTSEAQKVPGFVCFISADDVPGSNITGICNDEMVFAKDEVTCVGHIIGAVVTDTREHAQRAAQAVKITYEDLPAIITIEDAIKSNSFYEPELKIEKGNLTNGFSEADNIVSGTGAQCNLGEWVGPGLGRGRGLLRNHSPFRQVGFMKTGRVVALQVEHYSNAGNSMDLSQHVSRMHPCILGVVNGKSKAGPTSIGLLTSCLIFVFFSRENCWKKRGLSIIPTKFGISFSNPFLNQGGALIHVYTDGSVLLTHGGTEMGQGLHTKMVQQASSPVASVSAAHLHVTSGKSSPLSASVSSSEACQTILKRLEPFKKKNPSGSWEDWVMAAYLDAVSLSATGFYKTPNLGYSFETNSGNAFHYFSYGVACSEVEIDCLTGDHKVRIWDWVQAVGSESLTALQVEGAFVQGLGLFTLEELHYSPEGSLHTRGPSTYKIPAFGSIPSVFRVSLLRDCPNKKAIYASKAVGEPPLFLAASIFFAIKDAIHAARAGNMDHKMKKLFQLDSPATQEKIRNACVDKFTRLV
uniref:FAD-binding PCMH-type domain-containing protein n=1 Tax=Suricata suricatta TaxID=37032 RepID=A0A673TAA5_SURSU